MKKIDLEHFVTSMNKMADASGQLIRDHRWSSIEPEIKADGSPVTSVDQAVEERIREIIATDFPEHGICGEEFSDVAADSEFVWVIDPIDGTLPFLAGFPVFGTLIALLHHQQPILGTIDMPITADRWIGGIDRPTTLNDTQVQVRHCSDLSKAMFTTSNPDFYDDSTRGALDAVKSASQLNLYGGSCMAYGQLASGRLDVAMDVQFDIYDYLPLVPVIQGAGGIITDWQGRELDQLSGDKFLACGDKRVHEQVLKILQSHCA